MAGAEIARIKVTLQGVRPPIWRRIEVPTSFTFAQLSDVILAAFGWTNSHLHEFEVGKRGEAGHRCICMPDPDGDNVLPKSHAELARLYPGLTAKEALLSYPPPRTDEAKVALSAVLVAHQRLTYVYDFGDDWRHAMLVEAILPAAQSTAYPRVAAGRRAAPPEDCGGTWGYEHLIEVLADPEHDEYAELREWRPYFAAEEFDLAAADEAVRHPPEYWE